MQGKFFWLKKSFSSISGIVKKKSLFFLVIVWGCAGPSYDQGVANSLEIQSVIEQVNEALAVGDCVTAYQAIFPLYNSINSNNAIREAILATYGCYARVNPISLIAEMISDSSQLGNAGLFGFLVKQFPSQSYPDDKIPQSAEDGIDVAMSMIQPGTVLIPQYTLNAGSNNPQSLLYTDRTSDANAYLLFLSMALLGSLAYRNGSPNASFQKTVPLPWSNASAMAGDGCAYAGALLHLADSLSFLVHNDASSVGSVYQSIQSFLEGGLDLACQAGCTLCGVSCTRCPVTLRDRTSCQGFSQDVNSCAAAGIVTFVNAVW
jgi:hypothetical protein